MEPGVSDPCLGLPCPPLPMAVAILALPSLNYCLRQVWPRITLHYVIAIGAAPPSCPTPAG